jgi:hypothetical protein
LTYPSNTGEASNVETKRKFFEAEAFIAGGGGNGGIKPPPPPSGLVKVDEIKKKFEEISASITATFNFLVPSGSGDSEGGTPLPLPPLTPEFKSAKGTPVNSASNTHTGLFSRLDAFFVYF